MKMFDDPENKTKTEVELLYKDSSVATLKHIFSVKRLKYSEICHVQNIS